MADLVEYRLEDRVVTFDLPRSAPIQLKPFPRIAELCAYWKGKGYHEIVDVGCGALRNSLFLVRHFALWICDFPRQFENPCIRTRLNQVKAHPNFKGIVEPSHFAAGVLQANAGVVAYVLHTLPEVSLRAELILNVVKNTRFPHEIFIAVPNGEPYYRRRMAEDNRFGDGYVFEPGGGHKTFYREYSAEQIDEFMGQLGFRVERTFAADRKNQRTYVKES